ncbi:MAG TPA: molybdenum cofactor biosynthesis protein MoaE [Thermoanaerobaculia bacterium]|nr:molybdenum cofactor biosynthesis protein MoaE [Thermoanaerobaculia bacterium]
MHLTRDPIDVAALLSSVRPSDGGVCLFLGVVRNENAGRSTTRIEYEAYGPMAEDELARIARGVELEWPGVQVRVRHRVGSLEVGEASVAILACAPHRADAFAACRAAIDRIKSTVPIWKKEFHPDGSSDWVDPTRGGVTGHS